MWLCFWVSREYGILLIFIIPWSTLIHCGSTCLICFALILWLINNSMLLMLNPFLFIRTVLFQTIQFSMSTQFQCKKQFYFKQFSLAWVHSFNIKKHFYFKQFSLAWVHSFNIKKKQLYFKQFSLAWVHRFNIKKSCISNNSIYHKYAI